MILSIAVVIILIFYIAIIKLDAFALLEKAGIDTSGRVTIYNAVDKYYEFSPEFFGNGIARGGAVLASRKTVKPEGVPCKADPQRIYR